MSALGRKQTVIVATQRVSALGRKQTSGLEPDGKFRLGLALRRPWHQRT